MKRLMSVAAAAAGIAVASAAPAQQDFRWSGRTEQVQIRNVKGEIRAEPAGGGEVTVTAHPHGGRAERVRIEMVRRGGGVVICAVYPGSRYDDDDYGDDRDDDRDEGRSTPRDACSNRRMNVRDGDAEVDFVVHVPAGVRLAAYNVSGDVNVRGVRGPVDARSVSGDVHVSSSDVVEASSVSGDVYASMGRTGQDLEFRSVSGNVTLELPDNVDADFHARTLSGEIDSDFPLTIEPGRRARDDDGRWVNVRVGRDLRARIGRGGPALSVSTVSGDITLRRGR